MANRHRAAKLALCRTLLYHERKAPNKAAPSPLDSALHTRADVPACPMWGRHAHHRALSTPLQPLQPSNPTVPIRHIVSQFVSCTTIIIASVSIIADAVEAVRPHRATTTIQCNGYRSRPPAKRSRSQIAADAQPAATARFCARSRQLRLRLRM
jgi:hypothetical protein